MHRTETEKVISKLQLVSNPDERQTAQNAFRLHQYLATKIEYSEDVSIEKYDYEKNTVFIFEKSLQNGLIQKKGDCSTFSAIFKEILTRLGMKVLIVGLEGLWPLGYHAANLVLIGNTYYYFDSTIEGNRQKKNNTKKCTLAGLSSLSYVKETGFYPQVIVPDDLKENVLPLPDNISMEDLTFSTIDNDNELKEKAI
jgi:hypothetical protein